MLARPSGHRGNCNLDGLEVVPLRISSKFGPIRMALPRRYPSDAVSAAIQSEGYWEYPSVEAVLASRSGLRFSPRRDTANNDHEPQRAPTMLDIGANLGFYSLLFAAQGWSVLSIEAMEHNRRPLRASLCLNPSLNVTLIGTALGSANASRHRAQCVALSVERNRGNGFLACGEEAARMPPCSQLVHSGRCRDTMHGHGVMSWLPNPKCRGGPYDIAYCERVGLRSLDEVLHEAGAPVVDVLKLDVEGMECGVLDGGRSFLADPSRRPRLLLTEAQLINPLMPRLGSKSEACAWSMAQAYAYGGCKGEVGREAGFVARTFSANSSSSPSASGTEDARSAYSSSTSVQLKYSDRTLFLYQMGDTIDGPGKRHPAARKSFWSGGPRMPTDRAPSCKPSSG